MKIYKRLACLFFFFVAIASAQNQMTKGTNKLALVEHTFKYTNPITRDSLLSMRDYMIKMVGDKWYATGTSQPVWTGPNPGVKLLVSDDLINWEFHSYIIDASKLSEDCPYNGRFGLQKFILFKVNTG